MSIDLHGLCFALQLSRAFEREGDLPPADPDSPDPLGDAEDRELEEAARLHMGFDCECPGDGCSGCPECDDLD